MPQRRVRQPTPVSLPGESNGQRSWAGYGPWCCRESDTTERLSTHIHTHTRMHFWGILLFIDSTHACQLLA